MLFETLLLIPQFYRVVYDIGYNFFHFSGISRRSSLQRHIRHEAGQSFPIDQIKQPNFYGDNNFSRDTTAKLVEV